MVSNYNASSTVYKWTISGPCVQRPCPFHFSVPGLAVTSHIVFISIRSDLKITPRLN